MELQRFEQALSRRLQQEIDHTLGKMGAGQCKDYPEYRERVGEINGLRKTMEFAKTEIRKFLYEDEAAEV